MIPKEKVTAGKEALLRNDIAMAFDCLFDAAHLDQEARRLFLMIPDVDKRLFLLTEDQVELLEENASKEDALAQYTLGRYYQVHGDSFDEAQDMFIAAAKAGLGDACAALALMLIWGQLGEVEIDKEKYYQGLIESVEKGSMLGIFHLYKTIVKGFNGNPPNPQGVIDNIKEWLNGDETEDIQKVDPIYYEMLALAYEALDDNKTAADYYMKCVRMGRFDLHIDWVFNHFFDQNGEIIDENGEITDLPGFDKAVEDGIALGCSYSYLVRAELNQDRYDKSTSEKEQEELAKRISSDLTTAADLGEAQAYYLLGLCWYYGSYGFMQDYNVAFNNFLVASGMNNAEAWKMMGQMYLDHQAPDYLGNHFMSYSRLMGLRLGDDSMLIPVIISYYGGYLDNYKNEVQKYYIPQYNDLSDEEKTEYFDIRFIATIFTSGSTFLKEFDFDIQDWSELEEIIGAERLEAIHTKQLDEIGKKLGLEERITAWVDSDRFAKKLKPNTLGGKFSSNPILGDVVFTLEDDHFQPMAFKLEQLKQVIASLGGNITDIIYDEFPDDDSHWDPNV